MKRRHIIVIVSTAVVAAVGVLLYFNMGGSDNCVPCQAPGSNPDISLKLVGIDTFYVDDQSQFEGRPTSTKLVVLDGQEYIGMINRYENEIYLRAVNPRDTSLDRDIFLEDVPMFDEAEEFEFFAPDSILCYSKNGSQTEEVAQDMAFSVFDGNGKWVRVARNPGLKRAIQLGVGTMASVFPYVDGEAPIQMYQQQALITYYSDRTLSEGAPLVGMFSMRNPMSNKVVEVTHPCEYFGTGAEIPFLYRNMQTCLVGSQLIVSFPSTPTFYVLNLEDNTTARHCSASNYFSLQGPPAYEAEDIDYNDKASLLQKFGRYGRFVEVPGSDLLVRIVFPPIQEEVGPYEHYQKRKGSLIVFDKKTFAILGETDLPKGRGWDDWGIVANPKGKLYILDAYKSKREEFTTFGALVYKSYTLDYN